MKASTRFGIGLVSLVVVLGLLGAGRVQAATIYVSTAGNDANDGLTWATAKKTVQAGLNAAVSGDQVWVAAGTYVQCITLKAGVALYGGFAGTETDLSQRNWTANLTILDGNQAGSVVTSPAGATGTTRIDGFTIRNGNVQTLRRRDLLLLLLPDDRQQHDHRQQRDSYGGGIYCSLLLPDDHQQHHHRQQRLLRRRDLLLLLLPDDHQQHHHRQQRLAYGGGIYCYLLLPDDHQQHDHRQQRLLDGGGIYCYYLLPDDHQHDRRVQLLGIYRLRQARRRCGTTASTGTRLQLLRPDRSHRHQRQHLGRSETGGCRPTATCTSSRLAVRRCRR